MNCEKEYTVERIDIVSILDKFLLGVWNVGIIEQTAEQLLSGKEYKIRWMKHSYRDRFFADPFLLSVDEKYYFILAEEYPFYLGIGRIVELKIDKKTMRLVKRKIVIEEPYHLSYPFVWDKSIVPEAYRSGGCYAYQVPELSKTLLMPHGLIDQTFLVYNDKEWIFATDIDNALSGLKIYYRAVGTSGWHAHAKNPVKIDIHTARPGGHFFSVKGKLYRPVQDSEKLYGHKIRIMQVDKLSEEEFSETEVAEFSSEKFPPYHYGFHTFNVENGFVVVDGYKDYHSLFIKPMCLKARPLMKFIGEHRK